MAETQEQSAKAGTATEHLDLGEFSELLEKDFRIAES